MGLTQWHEDPEFRVCRIGSLPFLCAFAFVCVSGRLPSHRQGRIPDGNAKELSQHCRVLPERDQISMIDDVESGGIVKDEIQLETVKL